jgi:putative SOS response-associated peptidase YedK
MCGRFAQHQSIQTIIAHFGVGVIKTALSPRYNIAPGQPVPVLVQKQAIRLGELVWGLIPPQSKARQTAPRLINARAETVDRKPAFSRAFSRRRCLVLADGFYEWKQSDTHKQPVYFTSGQPFGFAGIWERWGDGKRQYQGCAILTRPAVVPVQAIHSRMPVILSPAQARSWISPENNHQPAVLKALLDSGPRIKLRGYPVSPRVNSPRYDGPECIRPIQ